MLEAALFALTLAAALGCGLVAGIFFAFSNFVMAALGRLPPDQGVAAMQAINVTVLNPGFLSVFLGTGVVGVLAAAGSHAGWGQAGGALILMASLLYLAGCIGVTMGFNVPLNEALAALPAEASEASVLWRRYRVDWTFWNHVRTVASAAAGGLFMVALVLRGVP